MMLFRKIFRHTPGLFVILLTAGTVWPAHPLRPAFADTSTVTCDNLIVSPAKDNYHYSFTAKSSGDGNITGYTFNFGDKQSYTFSFSNHSPQDRHQVAVMHAYQSPGVYTSSVQVNTRSGGDSGGVSSKSCRAVVNDGPATLVDTGAGNTVALFAAASLTGILVHYLWFRYFRTASNLD